MKGRLAAGLIAGLLAGGALLELPADEPAPKEGSPEKPASPRANRLISEKSPYLLQHAHNPVDWFPWGEEAFEKARKEGKPVFLSIGYSTCHWCHVMERESFENGEIARILNEGFVAIKVDREERPDVDDVYMSAVQALSGHGGWPLSVFLTPERKPFFGGTYFPPEDDPGRGRGFRSLLLIVKKTWDERRGEVVESADGIVAHLKTLLAAPAASAPPPAQEDPVSRAAPIPALSGALLEGALAAFGKAFDAERGGFGGAPKFPRTAVLDFLLAQAAGRPGGGSPSGGPGKNRERGAGARSMAFSTLDRMAQGGIRDHLAGGFHRYSTDASWTVPHFEKMLYDQALIARTYLDAGRLSGDARYLSIGREVLDYVLERLAHPEGGLFSAEDADSEGVEGKHYVWSRREVLSVLGSPDGELFAEYHGVSEEGNFEEQGLCVLTARVKLEELARKSQAEPAALAAKLAGLRRRLLEVRDRRVRPSRDDKVLTDWNGLAISALAVAYQASGERRYLEAAERAADFIGKHLLREGRLLHRFRDGGAGIPAFLEDHAFLAAGLLDLYEAGFDPRRLREAQRLAREMVRLFWDGEGGGFFQTGMDQEALIIRRKEFYDGAIPSGNSVAYLTLLRLREVTEDPELEAPVKAMDRIAARLLSESPTEHPQLLVAASYRLAPPRQIVVAGAAGDPAARRMVEEVQRRYLPARVLIRAIPGEQGVGAPLIPLLEGKIALDGKATAYVCQGGACKLPARDLPTLLRQLEN